MHLKVQNFPKLVIKYSSGRVLYKKRRSEELKIVDCSIFYSIIRGSQLKAGVQRRLLESIDGRNEFYIQLTADSPTQPGREMNQMRNMNEKCIMIISCHQTQRVGSCDVTKQSFNCSQPRRVEIPQLRCISQTSPSQPRVA